MARIRFSTYRAKKDGMFTQIDMGLGGTPPHPTEIVECKTVADVLRTLQDYADRVATHGFGAYISASVVKGDRKPAGFDKARTDCYVNLDRVAA